MAKKTAKDTKSAVSKKREPMRPETVLRIKRVCTHLLIAIAFMSICAGGFIVSKRYVEQRVAFTDLPPHVVMNEQPKWMSDALAEQILASVRPVTPFNADDHQLLIDRANLLAANPWVKNVREVRRAYDNQPGDTIVIDCDYRAPVALVQWQDGYWYVDADGVRLPDKLTAEQVARLIDPRQPLKFRIIDGIAKPPSQAGKTWQGADLQAGIEMIALLADVPEANEIVKIDVSNFGGRQNPNESQINLLTASSSQIRWGQPPSSKAFFVEQKVDRKIEYLRQAKKQTGRVDMNRAWIDLRFDSPTVPDASRATIKE